MFNYESFTDRGGSRALARFFRGYTFKVDFRVLPALI